MENVEEMFHFPFLFVRNSLFFAFLLQKDEYFCKGLLVCFIMLNFALV